MLKGWLGKGVDKAIAAANSQSLLYDSRNLRFTAKRGQSSGYVPQLEKYRELDCQISKEIDRQ